MLGWFGGWNLWVYGHKVLQLLFHLSSLCYEVLFAPFFGWWNLFYPSIDLIENV